MTTKSQGSWFPSGYHGHFRSRSRNDFVNEYRHQAKPSPPLKFSKQLQERPTVHHFSKHDNRFSFLNTVDSFQDGLGKRKVQSNYKSTFLPDFISWVPHKQEIKSKGPAFSSYRNDFRTERGAEIPQILLHSAKMRSPVDLTKVCNSTLIEYPQPTTGEKKSSTTYIYTHRHSQPNPKVNTNMSTGQIEVNPIPSDKTFAYINPRHKPIYDRPKEGLTNLRRTRVKSAPFMRTTVADCLSWYRPEKDTIESLEHIIRPKTAFRTSPSIEKLPQAFQSNQDTTTTLSAGNGQRPLQAVATAHTATAPFTTSDSVTNSSTLPTFPVRTLNTVGNEPDLVSSTMKGLNTSQNVCTVDTTTNVNQSTPSQPMVAMAE